jgi:trimethylamine--corrinoid protein Co-methyltransferase
MNGVVAAMSGLNIINGLGALELGYTFDYAKFMLDIDMVDNIKVIMGGVDLSHEEMALALIKEKGPGGEFLSSQHTMERMRKLSNPKFFDRRDRKSWLQLEQTDIVAKAYAESQKIIQSHKPPDVSSDIRRQVDEIIRKYKKDLV